MTAFSGAFYNCTMSKVNRIIGTHVTNLEILLHASKVETDSRLIEVAVATNLEAGVLEDGSVVAP
jgi:hypothetical protein